MAGDTNFSNVSLLLHMDGANGATAFPDTSIARRALSAAGTAKISSAQGKFGGASCYLDGAGYVSFPYSTDFDLGAGDFTLEGWVYLTATPGAGSYATMIGCLNDSANTGWRWLIDSRRTLGWLSAYWSGGAPAVVTAESIVIPLNTWTHIASSRVGATLRTFVGGVLDSITNVGTLAVTPTSAARLNVLGVQLNGSGGYVWPFIGYIDDMRVTKGVGRYTATFAPPVAPYPDGMGSIAGTVLNEAGAAAARTVRAYRRDTGALVGSTASDVTTGAYTIYTPTLDECSVICLDDAAGTVQNDLILRAVPA